MAPVCWTGILKQVSFALALHTLHGTWHSEVLAGQAWHKVTLPFAMRKPRAAGDWRGDDLLALEFIGQRPAGEKLWMQIDNVEFY